MNNTASEHYMVERLIIDDLLCWAVNYKVIIATCCVSLSHDATACCTWLLVYKGYFPFFFVINCSVLLFSK